MPIFVYILLGIALLVTTILLSKIKVMVSYEDSLRIYAKFWFIKRNIYPQKLKVPKKDRKKTAQKKSSPPVEQGETEKSLPMKLWEMKSALTSILARFLNKLHFKFFELRANVACDNAAKTALAYAGVNQGISYIIEVLNNISNVEISSRSDICVNADFISQKSDFEGKIELYIRVFPAISVGLHAIKEYIKFKSTKEV